MFSEIALKLFFYCSLYSFTVIRDNNWVGLVEIEKVVSARSEGDDVVETLAGAVGNYDLFSEIMLEQFGRYTAHLRLVLVLSVWVVWLWWWVRLGRRKRKKEIKVGGYCVCVFNGYPLLRSIFQPRSIVQPKTQHLAMKLHTVELHRLHRLSRVWTAAADVPLGDIFEGVGILGTSLGGGGGGFEREGGGGGLRSHWDGGRWFRNTDLRQ